MKLWEALKQAEETGCRIRPTGSIDFRDAKFWMNHGPSEFLVMDWNCEEKNVEVARPMVMVACASSGIAPSLAEIICDELGL